MPYPAILRDGMIPPFTKGGIKLLLYDSIGAASEIRTRDLRVTSALLYRLS